MCTLPGDYHTVLMYNRQHSGPKDTDVPACCNQQASMKQVTKNRSLHVFVGTSTIQNHVFLHFLETLHYLWV